MNQLKAKTRNLWELTVLCLLRLRPMHPYEMQRLFREWHKDAFLDLKRGSLYHAIERLHRTGQIEPMETIRDGKRPERTVYRLTESGDHAGIEWLRELLANPVPEPTQFFAALSFLPHLTPDIVQQQLKERIGFLELEIASLNTVLETMIPKIGRLVLVEVEYLKAMRQADLEWVKSFLEDLRSGVLVWDPNMLRQHAGEAGKNCL
jgi:DNA-binding PadR family transcriptional regulator